MISSKRMKSTLFCSVLILFLSCIESKFPSYDRSYDTQFDFTCDFVIIGAGSGGATVASRLSEIEHVNVCIFEAGGQPDKIFEIPYKVYKSIPADYDWQFRSEPQHKCCENLINRSQMWNRGKVLGGTSTINNQGHTRGSKKDFDDWEKMGNDGWSYSDVLPFFVFSETNFIPLSREEMPYHGTSGPVPVSRPSFRTPLAEAWLKAGMELGFPVTNHNAQYKIGFMYPATTMKDGICSNTYKAFLEPYEKTRANLKIYRHSLVTRILFDAQKRAIGIEYLTEGKRKRVKAQMEVILSAGAVQSPQLLMVSGIGPADILQNFQIPIILDSPGVGKNLLNHMSFMGLVYTLEQNIAFNQDRDYTHENYNLWYYNQSGPLSVIEKHEGKAYIKTKISTDTDPDYPDLELKLIGFRSPNWGVSEEEYNENLGPFDDRDNINFIPIMLHPKSKGYITIQSNDTRDSPIIEPNSFDDPQDLEVLLEAAKIIHNLTQTKAFQQFGTTYHGRQPKGCEKYQTYSDDYWKCIIKKYSYGFHHPVGTCKMGPHRDSMAVVNPRLSVHGVSSLRVIDASIMPYMPSAHTSIPTIMIAEKGSYMIKEDHRLPLPQIPKVNLKSNANCFKQSWNYI